MMNNVLEIVFTRKAGVNPFDSLIAPRFQKLTLKFHNRFVTTCSRSQLYISYHFANFSNVLAGERRVFLRSHFRIKVTKSVDFVLYSRI